MTERPIGIFDSGVGGLTVLAKVKETLPNESIIYVGDTANAPYGGKSREALLSHARDIIRFLKNHDAKAVVLACGTTSSTVFQQLSDENPDIPLVDVIRPGVKACIGLTSQNPGLKLGLIATAATIKSGLFAKMLQEQGIPILAQACPLFAPMVEAGVNSGPIAEWAAEAYIGEWRSRINALVLGCTHYPLLADALTKTLGSDIKLINLASHAAEALKIKLAEADCLNVGSAPPTYRYYVSGEPDTFNKTARFLLGKSPGATKITTKP